MSKPKILNFVEILQGNVEREFFKNSHSLRTNLSNIGRLNQQVWCDAGTQKTRGKEYTTVNFNNTPERDEQLNPWHYRINKYGYRGSNWSFDSTSVPFFGCSNTFNIGVEHDIASIVEREENYTCHNLGIPGGSIPTILKTFIEFNKLHPTNIAVIFLPPLHRVYHPTYSNTGWQYKSIIAGTNQDTPSKKKVHDSAFTLFTDQTSAAYMYDYIKMAEMSAKMNNTTLLWTSWDSDTYEFLSNTINGLMLPLLKLSYTPNEIPSARDGLHPGQHVIEKWASIIIPEIRNKRYFNIFIKDKISTFDSSGRWKMLTSNLKDLFSPAYKSLEKCQGYDWFVYEMGTTGLPENWIGGTALYPDTVFDVLAKERPEVIKAMQQARCLLHLDQSWEGTSLVRPSLVHLHDSGSDYYDIIYNSLDKLNISPDQLLISTSNLHEKETHDRYHSHQPIKIKIAGVPAFAKILMDGYNKERILPISFDDHLEYKLANVIKDYSCLNRVDRPHRRQLVAMLEYYNLLSNADYSHDNKNAYNPTGTSQLLTITDWNSDLHPAFAVKRIKRLLKNVLPLVLDQSDTSFNTIHNFFEETYLRTWFSVITETFFDDEIENTFYLSEKIFKPMFAKHPFIIVGQPNAIKHLHTLGFKTFGKWWDESYSDIDDPIQRLDAICKLIDSLKQKTKEEWIKMYEDMQHVLEYNSNRLITYNCVNYTGII